MGSVGDFFNDLFGGGDEPTPSNESRDRVEQAKGRSQAIRSALAMTEGGILGEELEEGEVKKRKTLFGN